MKRLGRLFGFAQVKVASSPQPSRVESFYRWLSNTPQGRAKLEEIRKRKKRFSLLPDKDDFQILAEAIALKKEGDRFYFVTGDKDFTEFKNEISKKFGLDVLDFFDLIYHK
ncbi:MAG: hypothetical protein QMC77_05075 [Methanocellales archaeon]|nr:hypothetical protein [Methanocellales archaeon]